MRFCLSSGQAKYPENPVDRVYVKKARGGDSRSKKGDLGNLLKIYDFIA